MGDDNPLLDKLPSGTIVAKDLSIDRDLVPGNPFCRYKTDTQERKYCSRSLWEDAKDRFVIPEGGKIPRPMVVCEQCGNDSYKDSDDCCGHCGCQMYDCPNCGEEVHGKVDACPHCERGYRWPDEDDN